MAETGVARLRRKSGQCVQGVARDQRERGRRGPGGRTGWRGLECFKFQVSDLSVTLKIYVCIAMLTVIVEIEEHLPTYARATATVLNRIFSCFQNLIRPLVPTICSIIKHRSY